MKIVYRITEQDYMEAHDLLAANEPWYRRSSRRLLPWLGGLLLVTQLVYLVTGTDRNPTLLAFGFSVGAYLLYCGFALRRYFRLSYRKDKRFQQDLTADVSEDGIHVATLTADSQMKWGGFIRFLEFDKIFMLFHAQWIFNIFPKRAFTPTEADEFRELLCRNIPATTRPSSSEV
jgi:hypothetical protein